MKLFLKKRTFSWHEGYEVLDENGKMAYTISCENEPKFDTLHVVSQYGGEVGKITRTRKKFSKKYRYEIFLGDEHMAYINERLLHGGVVRYELDYVQWKVRGDILNWTYDITDEQFMVAHAGDENEEYPDKFVLDLSYSNNEVPILLVALGMEAANSDVPPRE